jgi:hydrogenase maturation protein HypF
MAMAHAMAADVDPEHAMLDRLREQAGGKAFGAVRGLIARPQSVPRTSSMGRLFDGVAALAGVRSHADFEGQAAMELEALAAEPGGLSYTFQVTTSSQPWVIEAAPVIRDLVRDVLNQQPIARIAGSFHEAVAAMIVDVSTRLSKTSGVRSLVLTGGVFQNALLTEAVLSKLSAAPLDVFTHQRVPSNDGGLALGQALFAARLARIGTERELSACV